MTQQDESGVPEWTLGWRLQRALDFADVSVEQMARELEVSRATLSRWMHDIGAPPRAIYLRAWAARCKVPQDWLTYGDRLPRVDSNHQPADQLNDLETFLASPGVRGSDPRNRATAADVRAFIKALPLERPGLPQTDERLSSRRSVAR